jgi:hypothetical protein
MNQPTGPMVTDSVSVDGTRANRESGQVLDMVLGFVLEDHHPS